MSLKSKRMMFVLSLISLFIICFIIMNKQYDELARYSYKDELTQEQRELILDNLNKEDINYISAQQIKPDEFLPFITMDGFYIRNAQWYSKAKSVQDQDNQFIVTFINTFHDHLTLGDLEPILTNYTYETLEIFYEKGNDLIKNATLVSNPSAQHLVLTDSMSVYTYEPKNLVNVSGVPFVNVSNDEEEIYVQSEVMEPLRNLCDAAVDINGFTCGNLIVTQGYVSYKHQMDEYETMLLKYGPDKFSKYSDYPGQSESQLGYTIKFSPAQSDGENKSDDEKSQALWLNENAYRYGFVVRYPKDKEHITGKEAQPYTLRYVGIKVAKEMHDKQFTLNEMVFKNE